MQAESLRKNDVIVNSLLNILQKWVHTLSICTMPSFPCREGSGDWMRQNLPLLHNQIAAPMHNWPSTFHCHSAST